jgi:hypothetical protein
MWWYFNDDMRAEDYTRFVHWLCDNWTHIEALYCLDENAKYVQVAKEDVMPCGEIQWSRIGFPVSLIDWGVQVTIHFRDKVAKTRFHLETGIT